MKSILKHIHAHTVFIKYSTRQHVTRLYAHITNSTIHPMCARWSSALFTLDEPLSQSIHTMM